MEYTSIKPCTICGKEIQVANVRQKHFFCPNCRKGAAALERYGNNKNTTLSDGAREKLAKDKTLRIGPFNYRGKNGN